jgi:hypothetical protein
MSRTPAFDAWIAKARAVPIKAEIERRGIKLNGGKIERCGSCPRCGGTDRFSVNTKKGVFNCRHCGAKGDVIEMVRFLDGCDFIDAGTTLTGEPPPKGNGKDRSAPEPKKIIAAAFTYENEDGSVAFVVERVEFQNADGYIETREGKRKKTFRQRRPDPDKPGQWIWNVDGVPPLIYRLPEVIEALGNGRPVAIVEGEGKADLLWRWNVPATCCAMGAGKWKAEHAEFLRGVADVIILPDNDEKGREHAEHVAASLRGIAASVRILDLPGLPEKGDVLDWAAAGGTAEQLWQLVEQARPWTPPADDPSAEAKEPPAEPRTLSEVHDIFRRWFGQDYDIATLDAVLAVAAAERLAGDPAWLLIISGPGNAKTETVQATSRLGVTHIISTLTSDAALLSATPRKQRSNTATGGLLRKIGKRGIMVVKDFTSILSTDRNVRSSILAALREIHDGQWVRNVGTDGGQTLTWNGRIVVIGACTTAWDQAHAVVSTMGDRFVLIRSDSHVGRIAGGRSAMRHAGDEARMREELAAAVAGVVNSVDPNNVYALTEDDENIIVQAADVVTLARTGVELDYRGDVIDAHAPEMPTRFAKQLTQIMRGAVAVGMSHLDALRLVIRCARDSMPQLRLAVLADIAGNPDSPVINVRRRLQKPRATVDRALQALHTLGLLTCREEETERAGKEVQVRHYSLADGINLNTLAEPEDDLFGQGAG